MRHLLGFLLGLILAPLIVVPTAWAAPRLLEIAGYDGTFVSFTGLLTLAVLVVLATVVALVIAAPRLTPFVPGVAGLALVGATAALVLRPGLAERLPRAGWIDGAVELLLLGVYLPLGAALLLPVLIPSRWRNHRRRGAHAAEEDEYLDGIRE